MPSYSDGVGMGLRPLARRKPPSTLTARLPRAWLLSSNHSTAAQRVGAITWRVLTMPSLSFFRCAWLALSAFVFAGAAQAQAVADPAAELGALTQRWLDDALTRSQAPGATLRMEVSVGTLDSRLRLAPCSACGTLSACRLAPVGAHPAGFALRGGQFRMECLPARHHQGLGPGLGAYGQCRPGAVLTANDAAQAGSRLGRRRSPVLANPEAWLGQTATRQLMAGQALRQSMVKAPSLFKAGAQVRVSDPRPGLCCDFCRSSAVCRLCRADCARANGQWSDSEWHCFRRWNGDHHSLRICPHKHLKSCENGSKTLLLSPTSPGWWRER